MRKAAPVFGILFLMGLTWPMAAQADPIQIGFTVR
jgi:hypothetical protein